MVRYIFSLVCGMLSITFIILVAGQPLYMIWDFPSIIVANICPFVLMYILNGNNALKMAFCAPFKKENDKESLLNANEYFKTLNKLTWRFVIALFIIGIMGMLRNIEDKAAIGPNLSMALVIIVYAALENVLLIIPFEILINKKLKKIK
ncbi:hypothetical protein FACS1894110_19900 [Spirochaetia bacterium]|nr:hypothetical protein FACS1894110_19900 [Spirochaetia bacterium]